MRTRKLTLQEWFQAYQFRQLTRRHLIVPSWCDFDVTAIARRYREKGQRMPHTAVLAKAMGMAALRVPEINAAYVPAFWGERLVMFEEANVNLPVLCEEDGIRYLNVTTVTNIDRKTITEIGQILRQVKTKKLSDADMTLTRLVARGGNHVLNRLRLKLIHFLVMNFPQLWKRRPVGGVSLSSVMAYDSPLLSALAIAYGPTTVSGSLGQVLEEGPDGRTVLRVGFGFDHSIAPGYLWRQFGDTVAAILVDEALLPQFD